MVDYRTFVFEKDQKLKVGGTPDDPNVIISASGLIEAQNLE